MKSRLQFIAYCSVLATAVSFGVFAHSANEAAPRGDQGWKDRQELLNKRAAEAGEKAQVIFIGDSITQGWEGAGKEVWAKYYAHRNAVNLGIGGDRTQHVLWRLDNGNLNGLKPKAAVVMIGTNNSNGEDNTVDQIADGVTAIVKKLREKLPHTKILLLAIFPRSENPSAQRGKVLQVNQIIQKLADEQNVFWIDFGYRFVSSDGTIPNDLMPDYLHLSARGYEIWAEAIEAKLSAILGDARVTAALILKQDARLPARLNQRRKYLANGPVTNQARKTSWATSRPT
jgi:beta-glucosidase